MKVHGVAGYEHLLRDLTVGKSLGDEVRDGGVRVSETCEAQCRAACRIFGFEMHDDADDGTPVEDRLYMSHRTVGSHLYRIFPKLGLRSRVELARVSSSSDPLLRAE